MYSISHSIGLIPEEIKGNFPKRKISEKLKKIIFDVSTTMKREFMIADENESKSIYLKNIIKYFTNLKDKVFKEKFFLIIII